MDTRVLIPLLSALLVVMARRRMGFWMPPRSRSSPRIVDGEEAKLGQFPHQALVLGDRANVCGGSLISRSVVLTSGFCVEGYQDFTIRLGGIYRTKEEASSWTVRSTWAIVHPDYNTAGMRSDDVAIIFLSQQAPLNSFIDVVALPDFDEIGDSFVGQTPLISGWGQTSNSTNETEVLQWTQVTVVPNRMCLNEYGPTRIFNSTLCAGNYHTGMCFGDHGSALVLKTEEGYKQIGIASFCGPRCNSTMPAGYARVTSYLDWIVRNANL